MRSNTNFWQNAIMLVRCCALCSRLLATERLKIGRAVNVLCEFCNVKLSSYKNSGWRSEYSHRTLSAYYWCSQNYKLAQTLLISLKGSQNANMFSGFACEICKLRLNLAPTLNKSDVVFVPAAPRMHLKQDHAGSLAEALSLFTGFPVAHIFERTTKAEQKIRSKRERQSESIQIRLKENLNVKSLFRRETKIIFVDDVITTGMTAQSAYNLLGSPEDFEIWTIFNRPLLREESH